MTLADRRAAFAKLHESGCFIIPNPWDVGTARFLRHLGFRALATTSAGFQFSRGQPDTVGGSPRDVMLAHIAEIVAATDVPVIADFQSGYAHDPGGIAANVALCVDTGVAGLSIEDGTGDLEQPLYDLSLAVQRIKAARGAIDAAGAQVLLTARAESYLVGHPEPLTDALRRLTAYAEAGADVCSRPERGRVPNSTPSSVLWRRSRSTRSSQATPGSRSRTWRLSACGGSALGRRLPAPPGAPSSARPRRSPTMAVSKGSTAQRRSPS